MLKGIFISIGAFLKFVFYGLLVASTAFIFLIPLAIMTIFGIFLAKIDLFLTSIFKEKYTSSRDAVGKLLWSILIISTIGVMIYAFLVALGSSDTGSHEFEKCIARGPCY